jgi:hypothetical protein
MVQNYGVAVGMVVRADGSVGDGGTVAGSWSSCDEISSCERFGPLV